MPIEASGAAVHHGHVGGNAHFVDVSARIDIVERVEDEMEALEKVDVESRVFDVCVIRFDLDVRVELARCLFSHL